MVIWIGGLLPSDVGIVAEPKDVPNDIVGAEVISSPSSQVSSSRICNFAPMRDIVFADLVDSNTQITSMATKTFKVMDGKWEIDFDDEGNAVLVPVDQDKDEILDVDDVLDEVLLRDTESGDLCVQYPDGTFPDVDMLFSAHENSQFNVTLGCTAADCLLNTSTFQVPRFGHRLFTAASDVFTVLRMKGCQGIGSRWVNRSYATWNAYFKPTFGIPSGFVVFGSYYRQSMKDRAVVPWEDRCLASTSIILPGLLALLFRWACCGPSDGGLRIQRCRNACMELADVFIQPFCKHDASHKFRIEVFSCRAVIWPRPWVTDPDPTPTRPRLGPDPDSTRPDLTRSRPQYDPDPSPARGRVGIVFGVDSASSRVGSGRGLGRVGDGSGSCWGQLPIRPRPVPDSTQTPTRPHRT